MTIPVTPPPSWLDYIERVSLKSDRRWIFRGQQDESWELKAGIARQDKVGRRGYRPEDEQDIFKEFKAEALRFYAEIETDMELLALAQHHGLPTRLLDWSRNPLVAAWFACENDTSTANAAVHMIRTELTEIELDANFDPFNKYLNDIVLIRVPPRTSRITAQQGVFSVHCDPTQAWTYQKGRHRGIADYESFVIPAVDKPFFRAMLSVFGLDHARLMGGLDGVGSTLARHYRNL